MITLWACVTTVAIRAAEFRIHTGIANLPASSTVGVTFQAPRQQYVGRASYNINSQRVQLHRTTRPGVSLSHTVATEESWV